MVVMWGRYLRDAKIKRDLFRTEARKADDRHNKIGAELNNAREEMTLLCKINQSSLGEQSTNDSRGAGPPPPAYIAAATTRGFGAGAPRRSHFVEAIG